MAAKQTRSTEQARRGIQRGVDKWANAALVTLGPKEGDIALDKKFVALSIPKGGRTVRELAPPAKRYWLREGPMRAQPPPGSRKPFKFT